MWNSPLKKGEGREIKEKGKKINLLELNFFSSPKSPLWLKGGKKKGKNQSIGVLQEYIAASMDARHAGACMR